MSICWTKNRRSTKSVSPLKEISAEPQNITGGCKSASLFKPLAWLLHLSALMYNVGLLCDPEICSCRSDGDSGEVVLLGKPWSRLRKWSRIGYMVIVHSLPWSIVFKALFCFNKLTMSLFEVYSQLHIIFLLMAITASFATTVTTITFSSGLPSLARKLCFIQKKHGIIKAWSLKTVVRLGTLTFLMPITLPVGLCAGILFAPSRDWLLESYYMLMVCPYDIDLNPPWNALLSAWFTLSTGLSMASAIFSMYFYVWFCKVTSNLFDECSYRLRGFNTDHGLGKSQLLLTTVEFHRNLCELVHLGNGMFKYFVLAMYCMTIPSICLNVNIIFNFKLGSSTWINAICGEISMLLLIIIIVLSACALSSKAAQIRGDLCQLSVKEATNEDLQLVSFFATKLAGSPVGITVADMLVIDKGHILTLLGILLTYTVLIVQFDPSSIAHVAKNATSA